MYRRFFPLPRRHVPVPPDVRPKTFYLEESRFERGDANFRLLGLSPRSDVSLAKILSNAEIRAKLGVLKFQHWENHMEATQCMRVTLRPRISAKMAARFRSTP